MSDSSGAPGSTPPEGTLPDPDKTVLGDDPVQAPGPSPSFEPPADIDPDKTTVRPKGVRRTGTPPPPPAQAPTEAPTEVPTQGPTQVPTQPMTSPDDPTSGQTAGQTAGETPGMIGRYRLEQQVAANDMAVVHRATDTRLNRAVAIKVLLGRSALDPEFASRFDRQATLMAKLDSPHIIGVYTNGRTGDGAPYLVSQYADGGDLGTLLRARGRLPGPLAADICAQIADGLAAIHSPEVGVVHGDVKPSNILLRDAVEPPYVYLSDFAATRPEDAETARPGIHSGAWDYLAPERALGAPASPGSDLYSLGCLFYELVTGTVPFTGANDVETAMAHSSQEIPTLPGRDDFTLQANDLLAGQGGLLLKDPAARTAEALRVRDRFAAMAGRPMGFASGATVTLKRAKARRWIAAAAAVAVVGVGGAAVGITLSTTENTPAKPEPAVRGDVTGDGKGDLVLRSGPFHLFATAGDRDPVTSFASTGTGFEAGTQELGTGNLIGDLDADGYADVIKVSGVGSQFNVDSSAKSQPDGAIQVPVSAKRLAMFCADFDGDGRDDIAMISVGNGTKLPKEDAELGKLRDLKIHVTVMLSKADNTWAPSAEWFTGSWMGTTWDVDFEVGDVNGDKRADISFGGNEQPPAVVNMMLSTGTELESVEIKQPGPWVERSTSSVTFADVDGDGADEAVVYEGLTARVYDYDEENEAFVHLPSWEIEDPVSTAEGVMGHDFPAVADLNGDGRDDIVVPLRKTDGEYAHANEASVLLSGEDAFEVQTWTMPGADEFATSPPLRNASNNNGTGH